MTRTETNGAEAALALRALGWTLTDETRAARFLSLTGLSPEELRRRVEDPSLLAASLAFLEAHEPDLVACADALEVKPAELADARRRLEA